MPESTTSSAIFYAKDFLIPALAVAGSFAGAWVAAKLALNNFFRERVWERKTASYTAIFEAIHAIERWHDKHYEAAILARDITEDKSIALRREANAAEEALERRLAGEAWLLPASFNARISSMIVDLSTNESKHRNDWQGFLDEGLFILHSATKELLALARRDLNLK
ncbi:MAG: hypothetical protein WBB34_03895 [Xanthobacteraceae bacterium]